MTHILALIIVSLLVSTAFAFLMRDIKKDRILFGLRMFFGLVGFAFIAGWLAYFISEFLF